MKALTIVSAMIDTIALAVIANDRIERMTLRNADTSYRCLKSAARASPRSALA